MRVFVTMAGYTNLLNGFDRTIRWALIFAAVSLCACQSDSVSVVNKQSATTAGSASSSSSVGSAAAGTTTKATNVAPTIQGQPVSEVTVGSSFKFLPTVADDNGDQLVFSAVNLPAWANLDAATGAVTGTPAAGDVGTYYNITINVTDGKATVSLKPFSLAVTQIASGKVTLSWLPPTQNTDGSALANLAGYKIHYGNSADELDHVATISNSGITTHVIQNLSSGDWYFSLRAYTSTGVESDLSAVVGAKI